MRKLMVNIDHVATLREARGIYYPDPVYAAGVAEMAGASGIIVHLREDRRHIKDRDVRILRQVVRKLNLEMAATEEMVGIAREILPDMVTLVPEKRQELTTEGGLDVAGNQDRMALTVEKMKEKGVAVSLFIDADEAQVDAASAVRADMIEIHTGHYSDAPDGPKRQEELKRVRFAAEKGKALGMGVNAGHGLHYDNVREIMVISQIDELSIGHSIIARAVFVGLDRAVRDMLALMRD
ncbi:MAG: Pyridoxine 5'-phosphate synthase [Syntrophorhabdaceae bacterium PtaU1.Bin034]|nr:MAG: Pyridoxine 5'-phosphate synthase [Syntrophorhabdaceae bacterium PtaU1.Bin034]